MLGKVLGGRYEILEQIGGGGMALVYKARCQLLDRLVAVKVLKDEFVDDEEFVRKFKRESQAAASLSHPNIVNIYDVGVEKQENREIHYIVMEYIKGGTLKDLIRKKDKLSLDETIDYSQQIASALQDAHKNKIVHRDIKPQNIMITDDNRVKVTDFGIARASTSATVTTTSDALGSVHYFSPEQARGGYTDEKSDIYSLGIVMYEMATGSLPYQGESPITVALKHVQEEIIPPRELNKEIPEKLEKVILKSVQKRQSDRYQNISEMLRDLSNIKNNFNGSVFDDSSDTDFHTRVIPTVNVEDDYIMTKGKKKKQGKKDKGMRNIFLGIFLAFLLTTVAFYSSFKLKDFFAGSEEIVMINIVGMEENEAKEAVEKLGLRFEVRARVKNSEFEPGKVTDQDIKEGIKLKKNYPIQATISEGSDLVQVPNLINKTLSEAEAILESKGLLIGRVDYDESDTVPKDLVMEQIPGDLSEVEVGSRISIIISKGEEVKTILMPNITGWKEADAKNEILKLGLTIGNVQPQPSNEFAKGIVTWQSYLTGTELESKTVVDLYISSGPEETSEPEEPEEPEVDENEENPDNGNKEKSFTFTVTPLQEQAETRIKVIRIQDGASEVVYDKTHNVNEGEITITTSGKLGSKFEVYYDDNLKTTLVNQ